jgi:hypothetical protein
MLDASSSLSANLEFESVVCVQVVDQVPDVATLSVRVLRGIEHGPCFIEGQHSIPNDSGLQEAEPSMQLRWRPILGMQSDPFADPQKVLGA